VSKELFSVITTVGYVVVGFFLGMIGDLIKRKIESRERRLDEAYQKKMHIYEELLEVLSTMTSKENLPMNITELGLHNKIAKYSHILKSFIFRLELSGNVNIVALIHSFIREMREELDEDPDGMAEGPFAAHLRAVFCHNVDRFPDDFIAAVRKETGATPYKKIRKNIEAARKNIKV
jgi:hypothetical protein